tara:strand:- start:1076 stop:1249 length:174 start_codon:yes stop_codon:yes gene_type:complete
MNNEKEEDIDPYLMLLLVYGLLEGFELDISIDGHSIEQGYTGDLEAFEEVLFPDEFC